MAQKRGQKVSRGIALVLVMWVLSLLTVMALALTQIQRTESALTSNQLESARFRAQASAVLNLVALNLISTPATTFEDDPLIWIPDGRTRPFQFDGEEFLVALSNEGSKFDLNAITAEQLIALIELTQGEQNQDATPRNQIAAAIVDWRDQNNLSMLNGAEDEDYEAEGLPYGAADRPFRSVEELRQVLGMSASTYALIAPFLSVDSSETNPYSAFTAGQGSDKSSGQVDENFAAAPVLAVLQGDTLEDARRIVEERFQGLFAEDENGQRLPLDRGGPSYHFQITRQRLGNPGPTMEALIQIETGSPAAFELLWQRFGAKAAGPSPQDGAVEWP